MRENLARDSVRGAAWLLGTGYAGFAVNIIVNLLVARILYPEDFGVYGYAFAANELIGILGAFSIPLGLIHLEDSEEHLFDTGAWMNIATGTVGVLAAILIASLVLEGGLTSLAGQFLVLLALARLLTLMSAVSSAAMEKHFAYGSNSVLRLIATVVPSFLMLALAAAGCGPWSLVAREILTAVFTWLLIGAASPFRFAGRFSRATAAKIGAYCSRMFVSRALQIVFERFDRLLVGSFSGDRALGFYDRSRYIAEMGVTLARPLDGLAFNVYSRLRDDEERLVRAYATLNYFIVRAVVALMLVLLVFPREVVILVLGPHWVDAVPTLRWMALYACFFPISLNIHHLLYGRGLLRASNRVHYVQVAILIPLFPAWLWLFGAESSSFVLVLAMLGGMLTALHAQKSVLRRTAREIFLAPAIAFGISLCVLLPVSFRLPQPAGFAGALPPPLLCGAVYGLLLLLLERRELVSRMRLVLSRF